MRPDPTAPLHSERLDLLPIGPEHAEELAAALADPALHAFTGGSPATADDLRVRYARLAAGSPDPTETWGNWALRLRADGRLTGYVQTTVRPEAAELAWVVGTPGRAAAWPPRPPAPCSPTSPPPASAPSPPTSTPTTTPPPPSPGPSASPPPASSRTARPAGRRSSPGPDPDLTRPRPQPRT